MFQRTPQRSGAERVFILLVDGRPTQQEFTIIQRADELKRLGVRILPVVFEQVGFGNPNLWRQVSSSDYYISIDPSQYSQLGNLYLERIHNYACGMFNVFKYRKICCFVCFLIRFEAFIIRFCFI